MIFGYPSGYPRNEKKHVHRRVFSHFQTGSGRILAGSGGTCTRSWEGLTARGGLDGPHLGHPLRRDQVRGSPLILCTPQRYIRFLFRFIWLSSLRKALWCKTKWRRLRGWISTSTQVCIQRSCMLLSATARTVVPVTCVEKPDPRQVFLIRIEIFC